MRTSLLCTALCTVLGAACVNGTTAIKQNGLVPRPRADTYDGQPMPHNVELEGYATTTPVKPAAGSDSANGASIARTQLGGAFRLASGSDSELGVQFDLALGDGAVPTGPQTISPPTGTTFGIGATFRRSIPIAGEGGDPDGVRMGFSATLTAWSVARHEDTGHYGTDLTAVASFAAIPSKRFGNVVVFGGVTIMNMIGVPSAYIVGVGTDSNQSTSPANVQGGGAAVFSFGARVDLGENLSLVLQAAEPVTTQGQDVPVIGASVILGAGPRPGLRPPGA